MLSSIVIRTARLPVALGLVIVLIICSQSVEPVPTNNSTKISEHPVVLVVSYDGFRYDYFNKTNTPALNALREAGVRVPYLQPVFPTKTFANHQSIATGVYAETHGIVDNTVFDPKYRKTLKGSKNDPGFWNYHPDIMPIWIHNELAGEGRASGCHMWAGSSQPYGANSDLLPKYYYPGYNNTLSWEARVEEVISWLTNPTLPANLVFLYYNQPDSKGHEFGPNDPVTIQEIATADKRTAYLMEQLRAIGIFDKINLIMLSDHGMDAVARSRVINISSVIDSDLVETQHGGSPILQLTPKKGSEDDLFNSLKEYSKSHNFTVWKKEKLRDPFYYTSSRRILDYVAMADPGYVFQDFYNRFETYERKRGVPADEEIEAGLHGYTNMAPSMRAYFTAHGPAFKKNFEHGPIRNIDIVPLISTILGIPEGPNNGSLARVINMIDPSWPGLTGFYNDWV